MCLCSAVRGVCDHGLAILNFDRKLQILAVIAHHTTFVGFWFPFSWKTFSIFSMVNGEFSLVTRQSLPHLSLQFLTFYVPVWNCTARSTALSCPVFQYLWSMYYVVVVVVGACGRAYKRKSCSPVPLQRGSENQTAVDDRKSGVKYKNETPRAVGRKGPL